MKLTIVTRPYPSFRKISISEEIAEGSRLLNSLCISFQARNAVNACIEKNLNPKY